MVVKSGSVWAIDLGNYALKALHLIINVNGVPEVVGFSSIQHDKILNGAGVQASEKNELIALSLRRFLEENDLGKDEVAISVPSQNSFARFVKLPPVEEKRIPEIVRFEAAQQIPFDIDEVQWDWQLMAEKGTEKKVGIFAIKDEVVTSVLEHFSRANITVRYVQMAPMALYNYILYDRPDTVQSDDRAIVVIDIGAENTDLVVCTKSTVWQRCILMGGNAFTHAIAETFKLNFEKAEKLKRTAPMSKYARQIFQAMKPVFSDLGSEIQRSLGFYSSSNPNARLSKVVALGGGTKMRGLLKYLQQTLQVPVEKPDSLKKVVMNPSVSAAKFHENVSDFGVVYGLALQGLGIGEIESNLLPRRIARSMAWTGKAKHFIGAAAVLFLVSVLAFGRTLLDRARFNSDENQRLRREVKNVITQAEDASGKLESEKSKISVYESLIEKVTEPLKYRDIVPGLHELVVSVFPSEKNNPEQKELYEAFAKRDMDKVLQIPRKEREQIFITSMSIRFTDNLATAEFGALPYMKGKGRKGLGDEEWMDEYEEFYGMSPGMIQRQKYAPAVTMGRGAAVAEAVDAGFVVTIAGYSPYKNIDHLLDPPGVGDNMSDWGVVTRLVHLNEVVDGNCPYELYNKADIKCFKLETGPVDLQQMDTMPAGIGVMDTITEDDGTIDDVLLDPMTKEIISKAPVFDEETGKKKTDKFGDPVYEVNDHWFILNFKLKWKDAPKAEEEQTAGVPAAR